ncbi:hypothetical protein FE904_20570 [Chryseobacterium indologenes]|nr:hypothetical protein FE904_20570 [Chryseobacterium indologenes]
MKTNIILIKIQPTKHITLQVLVDKIICIEGKTSLDAGPVFNTYTWSTGATTQQINNMGECN